MGLARIADSGVGIAGARPRAAAASRPWRAFAALVVLCSLAVELAIALVAPPGAAEETTVRYGAPSGILSPPVSNS